MKFVTPEVPESLDALAADALSRLCGNPAVASLVIGGGVALKHYSDFRPTHDVDAWWVGEPNSDALAAISAAMQAIALERGLSYRERSFGEVVSYELHQSQDTRHKVFSFQVAPREVQLEPPMPSAWPPIGIETLADNVASKMNALVSRGAPRDFTDIYEIIKQGLATTTECWNLWERKNPTLAVADAKVVMLRNLSSIELRHRLESLSEADQYIAAERRAFFKGAFIEQRLNPPGLSL